MPHLRHRFLADYLQKLSRLWPVVGVIGPRQCGKSTLVREFLTSNESCTFDDFELVEEAQTSPKVFLAKRSRPIILDEVQKVPRLFDEIKRLVDIKKRPGEFILTGSSGFSSKLGIRESLTGRIGLCYLLPMTLAEMHQKPFALRPLTESIGKSGPRFSVEELAGGLERGGMPVPAFMRNEEQRNLYWNSWLDTTIHRDLSRFFKRGYDPDLAWAILHRMATVCAEGELPTLKHFKWPASKLRSYLEAMEETFLVRKTRCHPAGTGKDVWHFFDGGLLQFLSRGSGGSDLTLSLARTFIWNEWLAQYHYAGKRLERVYFKTAAGTPLDAVFNNVPIRITADTSAVYKRLSVLERPIRGAMKHLNSNLGILVAPVSKAIGAKDNDGIAVVPWTQWS